MNNKLHIEISNGLKDLDILKSKNLEEIEELLLIFFKPISIKFLKKIKNLKTLGLAGSSLKDYSPLINCLKLETLSISSTNIKSLDIINTLQIKNLSLELIKSKEIKNLSFLTNAIHLESINLFDVNIQELTDFSHLKKLKSISIQECRYLKSISSLRTAKSIESLKVAYERNTGKSKFQIKAEVADLLKELPYLKKLSVGNMIYDNINKEEIIKELRN